MSDKRQEIINKINKEREFRMITRGYAFAQFCKKEKHYQMNHLRASLLHHDNNPQNLQCQTIQMSPLTERNKNVKIRINPIPGVPYALIDDPPLFANPICLSSQNKSNQKNLKERDAIKVRQWTGAINFIQNDYDAKFNNECQKRLNENRQRKQKFENQQTFLKRITLKNKEIIKRYKSVPKKIYDSSQKLDFTTNQTRNLDFLDKGQTHSYDLVKNQAENENFYSTKKLELGKDIVVRFPDIL